MGNFIEMSGMRIRRGSSAKQGMGRNDFARKGTHYLLKSCIVEVSQRVAPGG